MVCRCILFYKNSTFTADTYSQKVQRDAKFKQLESQDIEYFKSVLPENSIITDEDDLLFFNEDWMSIEVNHNWF